MAIDRWFSLYCITLILAGGVSGCGGKDARTAETLMTPAAERGQVSRARAEALLGEVAAALCRGDRRALQQLMVTEEEYRTVILPGSVEPGKPWVEMPARKAEFFTRLHRTKSEYALAALLAKCPVASLEFHRVELPQAEERAGYTLYRNPRLLFHDPDGAEVEVRPGSVVLFGNQVKMLSYYID